VRHEIEYLQESVWAPAVVVWDDVAGTLEWTRGPDRENSIDPIRMQGLVDLLDLVRNAPAGHDDPRWDLDFLGNGRITIEYWGAPIVSPLTLDDAAHDPADFLRLFDWDTSAVRCGDVRLPASLRDVEMTPAPPLPELPGDEIA
jgi:hypothetical protein